MTPEADLHIYRANDGVSSAALRSNPASSTALAPGGHPAPLMHLRVGAKGA